METYGDDECMHYFHRGGDFTGSDICQSYQIVQFKYLFIVYLLYIHKAIIRKRESKFEQTLAE